MSLLQETSVFVREKYIQNLLVEYMLLETMSENMFRTFNFNACGYKHP